MLQLVAAGIITAAQAIAYLAMVGQANSDPEYAPLGDLVMSARDLAATLGVHPDTAGVYMRRLREVWLIELLVPHRGRRKPRWNIGDPSRALELLEDPRRLCDVDAHDADLAADEADRMADPDRDRAARLRPDKRGVVSDLGPTQTDPVVSALDPTQTEDVVSDAGRVVSDPSAFVSDLDPTLIDQKTRRPESLARAREDTATPPNPQPQPSDYASATEYVQAVRAYWRAQSYGANYVDSMAEEAIVDWTIARQPSDIGRNGDTGIGEAAADTGDRASEELEP